MNAADASNLSRSAPRLRCAPSDKDVWGAAGIGLDEQQQLPHGLVAPRVAHLLAPIGVYGAERWTYTSIKYLERMGVQSVVVTIGDKTGADDFHAFLGREGRESIHLAVPTRPSINSVRLLRMALQRLDFDILHCHGFESDIWGWLATRGRKIKLVSTAHGWSREEGFKIAAYEWLGRRFLAFFDRIYAVSEGVQRVLIDSRVSAERVRLVLNAVDVEAFREIRRVRKVRALNDPLRALYVGRLCKPKGIFELLEAHSQAKLPDGSVLNIVGDGPERAALEKIARQFPTSAVQFYGATEDVQEHLRCADCLVLPSYSEGMPRSVMEAMAAGVPVLATNIEGIRSLIAEGITGMLFAPKDPTHLQKTFERAANNPEQLEAMAQRAAAHLERNFSGTRLASELFAEYVSLLGAKR